MSVYVGRSQIVLIEDILVWSFFEVFVKLRKATISLIVPFRPSVCPRVTTLLHVDGFS